MRTLLQMDLKNLETADLSTECYKFYSHASLFGTKVFLADFLYHSTRGTFFPSSSDRKMNYFPFYDQFFKNAQKCHFNILIIS